MSRAFDELELDLVKACTRACNCMSNALLLITARTRGDEMKVVFAFVTAGVLLHESSSTSPVQWLRWQFSAP